MSAPEGEIYLLLESQIAFKSYARTYRCQMQDHLSKEGFVSIYDKSQITNLDDNDFVMARIYHGLSILQHFKTENVNTYLTNSTNNVQPVNISLNSINNNNNNLPLINHRCIPDLLSNSEDQDSIEIITEYVPDNITQMIDRKDIFCEQEAIYLLKILLRNLNELHHRKNIFGAEESYINTRMNPASMLVSYVNDVVNVMFSNVGDIYEEDSFKNKGKLELEWAINVSEYAAPETLKHNRVTVKSNLWTIGCVFYELLFNEKFISFEKIKSQNNDRGIKRLDHERSEEDEDLPEKKQILEYMRSMRESLRTDLICKNIHVSNWSIQILEGLLCLDEQNRLDWEGIKQKVFSQAIDKSIEDYNNVSNFNIASRISQWSTNSKMLRSNVSPCKSNYSQNNQRDQQLFIAQSRLLNTSKSITNSQIVGFKSKNNIDQNVYMSFTDGQDKENNNDHNLLILSPDEDINTNNNNNNNQSFQSTFVPEQDISLHLLKESFMHGVSKKSIFAQGSSIGGVEHIQQSQRSFSQGHNHQTYQSNVSLGRTNPPGTTNSFNELFVPLADPSKGLIYQANKSFSISDFNISTVSNQCFLNSNNNNNMNSQNNNNTNTNYTQMQLCNQKKIQQQQQPEEVIEGEEQSSQSTVSIKNSNFNNNLINQGVQIVGLSQNVSKNFDKIMDEKEVNNKGNIVGDVESINSKINLGIDKSKLDVSSSPLRSPLHPFMEVQNTEGRNSLQLQEKQEQYSVVAQTKQEIIQGEEDNLKIQQLGALPSDNNNNNNFDGNQLSQFRSENPKEEFRTQNDFNNNQQTANIITKSICISPEMQQPNKSKTLKQACSPPSDNKYELHIESSPMNSDRIASPCDSDNDQQESIQLPQFNIGESKTTNDFPQQQKLKKFDEYEEKISSFEEINPLEKKLNDQRKQQQKQPNIFKDPEHSTLYDGRSSASGVFEEQHAQQRVSVKKNIEKGYLTTNSEDNETSMLAGENKSLIKLLKQHQLFRQDRFSPLLNLYDTAGSHDEEGQLSKSNCKDRSNDCEQDFLEKIMQEKGLRQQQQQDNFNSVSVSSNIGSNNGMSQMKKQILNDKQPADSQLEVKQEQTESQRKGISNGGFSMDIPSSGRSLMAGMQLETQKIPYYREFNTQNTIKNSDNISRNSLSNQINNEKDNNRLDNKQESSLKYYNQQQQDTISSLSRSPLNPKIDKGAVIPSPHLSEIGKSSLGSTSQNFDGRRIQGQHGERQELTSEEDNIPSDNPKYAKNRNENEQENDRIPEFERKFTFNHQDSKKEQLLLQQQQQNGKNNYEQQQRKPQIFHSVYASQQNLQSHLQQANAKGIDTSEECKSQEKINRKRLNSKNNDNSLKPDVPSDNNQDNSNSQLRQMELTRDSQLPSNSERATCLREVHSKYINASDLKSRLEQFHASTTRGREIPSQENDNYYFEEQPIVGLDETVKSNIDNLTQRSNVMIKDGQNKQKHNRNNKGNNNNNNINEQYMLFDELVSNQELASSYMLNTKMRQKNGVDLDELRKLFEDKNELEFDDLKDQKEEQNCLEESQDNLRTNSLRKQSQKINSCIQQQDIQQLDGEVSVSQNKYKYKQNTVSQNQRERARSYNNNNNYPRNQNKHLQNQEQQAYINQDRLQPDENEGISEHSQIYIQMRQELNGDASFTSARGYEREVIYDRQKNLVTQRERRSSMVRSQTFVRDIAPASSIKDQILRENFKPFDKETDMFVFSTYLDPIEFQIQGYLQQFLGKLEDLFKRFNDNECINAVVVILSVLKIRLHHIMYQQIRQKKEKQQQQLQQQGSKKTAEIDGKDDLNNASNLIAECRSELRSKLTNDQNLQNMEEAIDKFLERSTLVKSKDLIEPHIYNSFRKQIFNFYNALTKRIYDSQNEQNIQLKLPYDKLIQIARLSYHLLAISHYSKVFKLHFQDVFLISPLPNLYDFIEEKIAFMDLNQLHIARQGLKQFLGIHNNNQDHSPQRMINQNHKQFTLKQQQQQRLQMQQQQLLQKAELIQQQQQYQQQQMVQNASIYSNTSTLPPQVPKRQSREGYQ